MEKENPIQTQISILISHMTCGGAERVAALLANGLSARGYKVSLITMAGEHEPFYPLDENVRLVHLDMMGVSPNPLSALVANYRRVRRVRSVLKSLRPDVVISFMTYYNVVCGLARLPALPGSPLLIGSERNNPRLTPSSKIWRPARALTYRFLDVLTCCGDGVASWFRDRRYSTPVVPIPNPVCLEDRPDDPDAESYAGAMADRHELLAMGRLHPQKGFDMLLEAFCGIDEPIRKEWHLSILGDGPRRPELLELRDDLGLSGDVSLPGVFSNPYPVLRSGDIYVMSSRYEGFPNALTEAMACGLPAVSFDCDYGPREIIRDGVDGMLVPSGDVDALAEALADLMSDADRRTRMAELAPEVLERFSLERFLDHWEMLIRRVSGGLTRRGN